MRVCDTKKFYDTEFQAQRAASKTEWSLNAEMIHYPCGTHWHISHKNKSERRGYGHNYWRCPHCKQIIKKSKIDKHRFSCNMKP